MWQPCATVQAMIPRNFVPTETLGSCPCSYFTYYLIIFIHTTANAGSNTTPAIACSPAPKPLRVSAMVPQAGGMAPPELTDEAGDGIFSGRSSRRTLPEPRQAGRSLVPRPRLPRVQVLAPPRLGPRLPPPLPRLPPNKTENCVSCDRVEPDSLVISLSFTRKFGVRSSVSAFVLVFSGLLSCAAPEACCYTRSNKDKFEPTSCPSVSGMACVESCLTLLVESEFHQHIKCQVHFNLRINLFTRSKDESVSGVGVRACFTQRESRT